MTKRFQDKVALITGAGGGIGSATARRLAQEGAQLALVDLDTPQLAAVAGETGAMALGMDVTDEAAIKAALDRILAHFGRLDLLVNNAGVLCQGGPPQEASATDWSRVLNVNLMGTVMMTKYAAPALIRTRGAIVNTASVAGLRAGAGGNAYSASKAAIINFTQTTARDFGLQGVRVNAVCPGLIETQMTKPVFDFARANGKEDRLGSLCELRRYGHPEEVAAVVAFLGSDDASYITGQALAVDGGLTASLNLPGRKF